MNRTGTRSKRSSGGRRPRPSVRDVGREVNRVYMGERWLEATKLIRKHLRRSPNDHWLLTRLASTYYERRRYREALSISRRALAVAPRCPLVLWDHAGILRGLRRHRDSIAVLRRLIRRGADALASGECGEGLTRARALVNDSRLEIARNHEAMGNLPMAKRYVRAYLAGRLHGPKGIYSKREAERRLRRLERS